MCNTRTLRVRFRQIWCPRHKTQPVIFGRFAPGFEKFPQSVTIGRFAPAHVPPAFRAACGGPSISLYRSASSIYRRHKQAARSLIQSRRITAEGSSCLLCLTIVTNRPPASEISLLFFPSRRASAPCGEREKHCVCDKWSDPKIGVRSRGRANRPDTLSNHVRKPTRRCVRPPERKCISDFSALLPVFPHD